MLFFAQFNWQSPANPAGNSARESGVRSPADPVFTAGCTLPG